MIDIDASLGEGGGQVVRSAVALAACTGQSVRLYRIREHREKPGLRAQHLAAVRAMAAICNAKVSGATVTSRELTFEPGPIRPGDYDVDVGTAGSTMLVLQTVLPALSLCEGASRLVLRGGTHNPRAPTFEFVRDSYLPLLTRLGFRVQVAIESYGFFPRGGGLVRASIEPLIRRPALELRKRGRIRACSATALSSRLPAHIAKREIATLRERLSLSDESCCIHSVAAPGAGNVVHVRVDCENVVALFAGFGERGVPAETVAARVADEVRRFIAADVAIDARLADQLLLPLALTAGGVFSTLPPTAHTATNAAVIGRFLPVACAAAPAGTERWAIAVRLGHARRTAPAQAARGV